MPVLKKIPSKFKNEDKDTAPKSLAIAYGVQREARNKKAMAQGGMVSPPHIMDDPEMMHSIVEAIMRKRKAMAEGGEVADIDANEEEQPNAMDELNTLDHTGEDEEEYNALNMDAVSGDDEEPSDGTRVGEIMKKRKQYKKD